MQANKGLDNEHKQTAQAQNQVKNKILEADKELEKLQI